MPQKIDADLWFQLSYSYSNRKLQQVLCQSHTGAMQMSSVIFDQLAVSIAVTENSSVTAKADRCICWSGVFRSLMISTALTNKTSAKKIWFFRQNHSCWIDSLTFGHIYSQVLRRVHRQAAQDIPCSQAWWWAQDQDTIHRCGYLSRSQNDTLHTCIACLLDDEHSITALNEHSVTTPSAVVNAFYAAKTIRCACVGSAGFPASAAMMKSKTDVDASLAKTSFSQR